jgi:hypothetical protein
MPPSKIYTKRTYESQYLFEFTLHAGIKRKKTQISKLCNQALFALLTKKILFNKRKYQ